MSVEQPLHVAHGPGRSPAVGQRERCQRRFGERARRHGHAGLVTGVVIGRGLRGGRPCSSSTAAPRAAAPPRNALHFGVAGLDCWWIKPPPRGPGCRDRTPPGDPVAAGADAGVVRTLAHATFISASPRLHRFLETRTRFTPRSEPLESSLSAPRLRPGIGRAYTACLDCKVTARRPGRTGSVEDAAELGEHVGGRCLLLAVVPGGTGAVTGDVGGVTAGGGAGSSVASLPGAEELLGVFSCHHHGPPGCIALDHLRGRCGDVRGDQGEVVPGGGAVSDQHDLDVAEPKTEYHRQVSQAAWMVAEITWRVAIIRQWPRQRRHDVTGQLTAPGLSGAGRSPAAGATASRGCARRRAR